MFSTLRHTLTQLLNLRFGVDLKEFSEHFDHLELNSLKQLNQAVFQVNTLAEFEEELAMVQSKVKK